MSILQGLLFLALLFVKIFDFLILGVHSRHLLLIALNVFLETRSFLMEFIKAFPHFLLKDKFFFLN